MTITPLPNHRPRSPYKPPVVPDGNDTAAFQRAPQRKPWYKHPGFVIFLIVTVAVICIIGGRTIFLAVGEKTVPQPLGQDHTLIYRVGGDSNNAAVLYTFNEIDTGEQVGVSPGWEQAVTIQAGFGATLIVTNGNSGEGSVTCEILQHGKVISESAARGNGGRAYCRASSDDLG